jgi:hypothetical protein
MFSLLSQDLKDPRNKRNSGLRIWQELNLIAASITHFTRYRRLLVLRQNEQTQGCYLPQLVTTSVLHNHVKTYSYGHQSRCMKSTDQETSTSPRRRELLLL